MNNCGIGPDKSQLSLRLRNENGDGLVTLYASLLIMSPDKPLTGIRKGSRSVDAEVKTAGKMWTELKRISHSCVRWRAAMAALCSPGNSETL